MRARAVTLGALLAALALAGCESSPSPQAEPTPSATLTPSQAPSPTAAPPPAAPGPVTIAVAGDVHFEGVLRQRLADPATALAPVAGSLAAADLAVVNLETAVGSGGQPAPGKRYTFQAPLSAFDALAAAGVDVATMANNHVLDFGIEGVDLAAVDAAPVQVVGIGRDAAEAFEPALTDVRGTVVATFGATIAATDPTADPTGDWAATDSSPGTADAVDPARLLAAVAGSAADIVVVHVHWGTQGESCPDGNQRRLARQLVAAGADVVVGSHAHRLQGDGRLGKGYVAYGLGNYAWYTAGDTTGVLTLTVQGSGRVSDATWSPARIGEDGLPAPRADTTAFERERAALRDCAGLSAPS